MTDVESPLHLMVGAGGGGGVFTWMVAVFWLHAGSTGAFVWFYPPLLPPLRDNTRLYFLCTQMVFVLTSSLLLTISTSIHSLPAGYPPSRFCPPLYL